MLSIPLTWPVGQGVKTSPSHGENTSSILVLAAPFFYNCIQMLSNLLTRPVGQGVKTSPSHGENTSSILVLAARNFRSDSEVFLFSASPLHLQCSHNAKGQAPKSHKFLRLVLVCIYFLLLIILPHPLPVLPG